MQNHNCEGQGPCSTGEVRVLPWTKDPLGGNSFLCRNCFNHEIEWREECNQGLDPDVQYALPRWETLRVYAGMIERPWASYKRSQGGTL